MPNWCENHIQFEGPEQDILSLVETLTFRSAERLTDLYPPTTMPFVLNTVVPGPSDNNWRIENWGIKWDMETATLVEAVESGDESTILFCGDTAWSPPLRWLYEASKKYPSIKFSCLYRETGMGFEGVYSVRNGQIETDIEREILAI